MEENVCASLLSLVESDLTDIVVGVGVAESHPNACPGGSTSTAKMEAIFRILLMRPTATYRCVKNEEDKPDR